MSRTSPTDETSSATQNTSSHTRAHCTSAALPSLSASPPPYLCSQRRRVLMFTLAAPTLQAQRATDELRAASKYQASLRKRKCCLYTLVLVGMGVLFLIFVVNLKM